MAIELKKVSFAYPNGFVAVENISLTIHEGERAAIVGQNGAGKTTLVKLMNGINKPSRGDVFVDGINTKERTTAQIARYVGYVFQNPDDQIFNQTVENEIQYMLKREKMDSDEIKRRTDFVLELTELKNNKEENPYDLPLASRKFLTIAAVLATKPRYLILDEPTAGQDRRGNRILQQVMQQMSEEGVAVITISHDMEFVANNFDRVIAMAHKNIICDGQTRDVFWNDGVIDEARIKRPEIAEIAEQAGYAADRILFCDELAQRVMKKRKI